MGSSTASNNLGLHPLSPGDDLAARYTLIERLNANWSGIGWAAHDRQADRQVVVNVLPKLFFEDPEALQALRQRGELSNAHRHPAFVEIHDWFATDEAAFYVTELVRGSSLAELRRRHEEGIFEIRDIEVWIQQLCDALQHLHAQGLAHGDLHSGQLLVDLRNQLRIIGFGIAQTIAVEGSSDADRFALSHSCKSPQQLEGEFATAADDLYAVGAILFHLLTGQLLTSPAFRGPDGRVTIPAVSAVRNFFGLHGKAIPPSWDEAIMACLHANPQKRPAAGKIAARLQETAKPPAVLAKAADRSLPPAPPRSSSAKRPASPDAERDRAPGSGRHGFPGFSAVSSGAAAIAAFFASFGQGRGRGANPRPSSAAGGRDAMVAYAPRPKKWAFGTVIFYLASLTSFIFVCSVAWIHAKHLRDETMRQAARQAQAQKSGTSLLPRDLPPDEPPKSLERVPPPPKIVHSAKKDEPKLATKAEPGPAPLEPAVNQTFPETPAPPPPPRTPMRDTATSLHPKSPANETGDDSNTQVRRAEPVTHDKTSAQEVAMLNGTKGNLTPADSAHGSLTAPQLPPLNDAALTTVGKRVWQNECDGKVEGLTSWNKGENFASLGIGHFIWYPKGPRGPFEESFPQLVDFLMENGVKVPPWLQKEKACPWQKREEFLADFQSPRMVELRDLLRATFHLQSRFLVQRLKRTVETLGEGLSNPQREQVVIQYTYLSKTIRGIYAMIDYVNFKGEGTNPSERYQGQGWGLLQVLEATQARRAEDAPTKFGEAAEKMLALRIKNSPPARNEAQWMQGWAHRVRAY